MTKRSEAGEGAERQYRDPKVAITKVYTRQGDQGQTRLVGGQKVGKDDLRIEAYGTVDELNAFVGAARQTLSELTARGIPGAADLGATLTRVQHELFNLGSLLATRAADLHPRQPRVTQAEVERLEAEMDRCQEALAPLKSFVLPGGSRLNTDLHVARTVCRRAERVCVALARRGEDDPEERVDPAAIRYLNRLSDALFVWSRWAVKLSGDEETLWDPNLAASGN